MYKSISFVIPLYNEEENIFKTINSISKVCSGSVKYEIVIVDNGSTDRSCEIVRDLGYDVYTKKDCNVGAVRNYGAKQVNFETLVFIDADCEIDSEWLKSLLENMDAINSGKVVMGGGIKLPLGFKSIEKNWLLPDDKGCNIPKRLIGASIAISRKAFWDVYGFSESVTSGEDSDFHDRLIEKGYIVEFEPSLSVVHNGNAKTFITFIKRQKWHAENYARNIITSLFDPVFILVNLFIILLILSTIFLASGKLYLFIFSLFFGASCPLILTLKRIYRSKNTKGCNFFMIYLLDVFYLVGRSIGYIKGFFTLGRS